MVDDCKFIKESGPRLLEGNTMLLEILGCLSPIPFKLNIHMYIVHMKKEIATASNTQLSGKLRSNLSERM